MIRSQSAQAASDAIMAAHLAGGNRVFKNTNYTLVLDAAQPAYRGAKCMRCGQVQDVSKPVGREGNLNKHLTRDTCLEHQKK
jgi:hypothetical protein